MIRRTTYRFFTDTGRHAWIAAPTYEDALMQALMRGWRGMDDINVSTIVWTEEETSIALDNGRYLTVIDLIWPPLEP